MVYVSTGGQLLDPKKILAKLGLSFGNTVADFGCGGNGHFIIPAAKMIGPDARAYGVDILKTALESMVSKARLEGADNIKPVWSDIEVYGATNIKKESLDFALVINNLFQSQKQKDILKEVLRLLKKSAKLLIVDWNQLPSPIGPGLRDRVKSDTIKDLASQLNLVLVDDFEAGPYHFGLIFRK